MKSISALSWLPLALGLLFIHHRLLGTIDWSWWLVVAPLWIPISVHLLATFINGVVIGWRRSRDAQRDARGRGGVKL